MAEKKGGIVNQKNFNPGRRCVKGGLILAAIAGIALPLGQISGHQYTLGFASSAQAAEEAWKQEFDDICSKTTDSMSLGAEELSVLIARCEKLKPVIDRQEETTRKVYSKRLESCKKLFVFVMESKQ